MGPLINHSRSNANAEAKVVDVNGIPRIAIVAIKEIVENEQILYNYGDNRSCVLKQNLWLKS